MRDYTVQEAADYLGVTRTAVYNAIHRGRLLSYKRGVTILIDKAELKKWDKIQK